MYNFSKTAFESKADHPQMRRLQFCRWTFSLRKSGVTTRWQSMAVSHRRNVDFGRFVLL